MNRHLRLAAVSLLAAAVLGTPVPAGAFGIQTTNDSLKGTPVKWTASSMPIGYYIDAAGTNGLSASQSAQCMNDSFQGWEDVGCSSLAFEYLGTTTNKKVLPMSTSWSMYENERNEVVWINDSTWSFGAQVLGVTMVNGNWAWNGQITESDIALNGRNYKWNLDGEIGYWNNDMDCVSVTIHEIGHLFGLQHVLTGGSVTDPPTMAPAVDPNGRSASLSADDQQGACFLYPTGEYYSCTKNGECPKVVGHNGSTGEEYEVGQIYCQDSYCQGGGSAPYSTEIGGTCAALKDCVSGLVCSALSTGITICTKTCDPVNDGCPDLFHCEIPTGGSASICVPGSKKKVVGEACSKSYDCATSFCHPAPDQSGMTCRQPCTKGGTDCPQGETCWASSFSSTGGCYPSSVVPVAKKKLDVECAENGECESGLCYSEPGETTRCRLQCDPAAAEPFCYANYWCKDLGNGYGGCVPGDGKKADGLECAANEECKGGWCVWLASEAKSWCRTSCELQTWQCAWGTSCVSYGSTEWGVCMPSVDKKGFAEPCGALGECTTGLCRSFDEGASASCTQNCIEGWCPNDWVCVADEPWGALCAPPGSVPQPLPDEGPGEDTGVGPVDNAPPEPDRGTPGEDSGNPGETDLSTGGEDTGWTPPVPVPDSKGCAGGPVPPSSLPWAPLVAALSALVVRRRRG